VKAERFVFVLAAAAVTSHLADHLIVGVEFDLQFDAVVAVGVVTVIVALVYPRLPRDVQVVGSITLGLLWFAGDLIIHVIPMVSDGPEATDYTGLAATLGGVLLIGVGVAAGLRDPDLSADGLARARRE